MQNPERFDPEAIAALIDGKLTGGDRSRAIEQLAESPEAFAAFSEAVRFREEQRVAAGIVDLPERSTRWPYLVPFLKAAAVVLLLGTPVWYMATRATSSPARGPVAVPAHEVVVLLQSNGFRVVPGEPWHERGWSVMRGGPTRLVEPSLAFRLGVRVMDLEVAVAFGDTAAGTGLVDEMLVWLGEIELSQPVAARYAALGAQLGAGAARAELVAASARAEAALDELLGSPSFTLGKWSGAAALAARERVPRFFESSETSRFLNRLDLAQFPGATEALQRVAELIRDGVDVSEFPELEERLAEVIRISAG